MHVHASLFERADGPEGPDGLGYNTAVVLAPDGQLLSRTRKLHIPITAGYYEDHYFRPGPAGEDAFPLTVLPTDGGDVQLGCPTCWDQWFPELARAYSLEGAEVLIYPTAIGSEPDHPDFDTQPLWQQVIVGAGIANGTFMVAVNRIGVEPPLTFYGSSFISDPYGRVLVQAPGMSRPCWSPISTWISAATGWSCSRSCARAGPMPTGCWLRVRWGRRSRRSRRSLRGLRGLRSLRGRGRVRRLSDAPGLPGGRDYALFA